MSNGLALPLVAMSAGAALMVIGSSQLSAAWLARDIAPKDRKTLGWVGVGIVALGTTLEAVASYELARARRVDNPDDLEELAA
jgi:hypothetical protein